MDLRFAEVLLEGPFFAAGRLAEERAEALRFDLIDFFVGIDATPRWSGRFDARASTGRAFKGASSHNRNMRHMPQAYGEQWSHTTSTR